MGEQLRFPVADKAGVEADVEVDAERLLARGRHPSARRAPPGGEPDGSSSRPRRGRRTPRKVASPAGWALTDRARALGRTGVRAARQALDEVAGACASPTAAMPAEASGSGSASAKSARGHAA